MKDDNPLFSKTRFNWLFDQAMKRALNNSYEPPSYSNEQIINSWRMVHQRLKAANENIHSEGRDIRE